MFCALLPGVRADENNLKDRYALIDRTLPSDLNLPRGSAERAEVVDEIRSLYFANTSKPTLEQYYNVRNNNEPPSQKNYFITIICFKLI